MDNALPEGAVGSRGDWRPLSILVIAATFPYPPDDGTKIQIFNRIRFLSERNTVTLLCIAPEAIPEKLQDGIKACCRILWLQAPISRKSDRRMGKTWNFIRSLCFGVPYDIKDFCNRHIQQAVNQVISEGRYDIIEADVHAAFFFKKSWQPFKVSIFHNVAATSLRRMSAHSSKLVQQLKYRIYQSLYENYERKVCRNSDLCVTLTLENETELRKAARGIPVVNCLTNGIDLDYFRYQPNGRPPSAVCFVGLMRYEPNIDAVLHFYREIFPAVRRTHGDLRYYVVGSSPSVEVMKLSDAPGVVVTDYVEDVRPWLLEAGIAVIPVRSGGGILNKILEALALGVPVVTYPACMEGLDAKNGEELLIAENALDFADSVKRLVESAALRKKLSENGRLYVESHHQWKPIIARYEDEIRGRLAKHHSQE
jgi:polysaccharide biosynthesis protein PslH